MWHFYLGAPLRLAIVRPDGTAEEILLGQDVLNGQYLQYTVPGGCWFGATPAEGSDFALVGCTVAPGFDFADFGQEIFLTKEEAEENLKKIRGK